MNVTENEYSLIAAPGYLSTSNTSIFEYIEELSKLLTKGDKKTKIGFLNGMNGHYKTPSGQVIIEEHNKNLPTHNFKQIVLTPKKEFDHRKMLCFFTNKNEFNDEITFENLKDFLDDIYVGAILIGSSNQSKSTYFNNTALKGEADIFILDTTKDAAIHNFIKEKLENNSISDYPKWSELFADIVITKSFYGAGHDDTQKFLKDILKDVLESGLDK